MTKTYDVTILAQKISFLVDQTSLFQIQKSFPHPGPKKNRDETEKLLIKA